MRPALERRASLEPIGDSGPGESLKMNFASIDPAIRNWAIRNHISLLTRYRDAEVRSFDLTGPSGRAQIWIETEGGVTVHVWDYEDARETLPSVPSALDEALDKALSIARRWCGLSD